MLAQHHRPLHTSLLVPVTGPGWPEAVARVGDLEGQCRLPGPCPMSQARHVGGLPRPWLGQRWLDREVDFPTVRINVIL